MSGTVAGLGDSCENGVPRSGLTRRRSVGNRRPARSRVPELARSGRPARKDRTGVRRSTVTSRERVEEEKREYAADGRHLRRKNHILPYQIDTNMSGASRELRMNTGTEGKQGGTRGAPEGKASLSPGLRAFYRKGTPALGDPLPVLTGTVPERYEHRTRAVPAPHPGLARALPGHSFSLPCMIHARCLRLKFLFLLDFKYNTSIILV